MSNELPHIDTVIANAIQASELDCGMWNRDTSLQLADEIITALDKAGWKLIDWRLAP